MKKYVFLTANIIPIGGMQLYTSGKAKFLKKHGWEIKILFDGNPYSQSEIDDLNQYKDGAFPILSYRPMDLPKFILKSALNQIIDYVGVIATKDEIIVESQSDTLAFWGELIAEKIGAKHICFNCNEKFRGNNKYYEDYIDFFYFKYQRGSLWGLHSDTMSKIFDGHYEIEPSDDYLFDALEPGPIQDVEFEKFEHIKICDYNIAYLGRLTKGYFPKIITGVKEFAANHKESTVNFIIIGDSESRKDLIDSIKESTDNLIITELGNLVPIPRIIYKKIDVMIAGAVCAEISARESVPTIVADCENYMANGVLGYTVSNSMYCDSCEGQTDYQTALEKVLIEKDYLKFDYTFPAEPNPDDVFGSQLEICNNYECGEYYTFKGNCKYRIKDTFKAFFKCYCRKIHLKYLNLKG